jgi:hypothetical protein
MCCRLCQTRNKKGAWDHVNPLVSMTLAIISHEVHSWMDTIKYLDGICRTETHAWTKTGSLYANRPIQLPYNEINFFRKIVFLFSLISDILTIISSTILHTVDILTLSLPLHCRQWIYCGLSYCGFLRLWWVSWGTSRDSVLKWTTTAFFHITSTHYSRSSSHLIRSYITSPI